MKTQTNCDNEQLRSLNQNVNITKLNVSKYLFDQSEIIFLGPKITAEGIHPDHNKVEVILRIPYPSDVKGLQRFLGMVNFLAKFIPNL